MEVCINSPKEKRFIDQDKYKGKLKFEEGGSGWMPLNCLFLGGGITTIMVNFVCKSYNIDGIVCIYTCKGICSNFGAQKAQREGMTLAFGTSKWHVNWLT